MTASASACDDGPGTLLAGRSPPARALGTVDTMPLIRIDLIEGRRDDVALHRLADTVYEVTRDVFAAPPGDRYEVITEHRSGLIRFEDTGLGLTRTDDVVLVQVFQQGRDTDQKQALYAALAERLERDTGLDPQDLVVSITANGPADWSFGLGRAQFLTGEL